nr:MAG TPA: hypothetical protein [Bacteriophage sp.]
MIVIYSFRISSTGSVNCATEKLFSIFNPEFSLFTTVIMF